MTAPLPIRDTPPSRRAGLRAMPTTCAIAARPALKARSRGVLPSIRVAAFHRRCTTAGGGAVPLIRAAALRPTCTTAGVGAVPLIRAAAARPACTTAGRGAAVPAVGAA